MDPATHNPIQDIYICQVIEKDGGISTKILAPQGRHRPGQEIY